MDNAPVVKAMLNLTEQVCNKTRSDPEKAFRLRMRAATLWASISEKQSETSCWDCERRRPSSCMLFFATNWGLNRKVDKQSGGGISDGASEKTIEDDPEPDEKEDRYKYHTERKVPRTSKRKLRESAEDHLDRVCCVRPRDDPDGPVQCDRKFCKDHVMRTSMTRMAMMLRGLHEKGHEGGPKLEPHHQVALEILAPHMHAHEDCRHDVPHAVRDESGGGPSDHECMARSILHHVGKKHGLDAETVQKNLDAAGMNMAEVLKGAYTFMGYKHTTRGDPDAAPPEYDPVKERKRRKMSEKYNREKQKEREQQGVLHLVHEGHRPGGGPHADSVSAHMGRKQHARRKLMQTRARSRVLFETPMPYLLTGHHDEAHSMAPAIEGATGVMASARNWSKSASAFSRGLHRTAQRKSYNLLGAHMRDPEARRHPIGMHINTGSVKEHTYNTHDVFQSNTGWRQASAMAAFVIGADGSIISRLADVGSRAAALTGRATELNRKLRQHNEEWRGRREERERMRRLSQAESSGDTSAPLYGENLKRALDTMYARFDRPNTRVNGTQGRRLSSARVAANAPAWHGKQNSWIVKSVDWRGMRDEALRLAEADHAKMRWWMDGAKGEMPEEAKTGYPMLDARIPPSTLGRGLRVLAHGIVNRTPAWEHHHSSRRLDAAVAAPNPLHQGGRRLSARQVSDYWTFSNPAGPNAHELLADALETRPHHASRVRRLGEAFFSGVMAVPYAVRTTATHWGTYEKSPTNWFSSALRYLIYDTVLCYMYSEEDGQESATSGSQLNEADGGSALGDGTDVKVHHSTRMCFPAIPFVVPKYPTFRELTNTQGVNFEEMSYADSCKTSTVKDAYAQLESLGISHDNWWAPFSLVMRTSEAIDAMRNFAGTETATTATESATLLLCGVMQLGGVLYLALLLPLVGILLICAPCAGAVGLLCVDVCCCLGARGAAAARRSGRSSGSGGVSRLPVPRRRGAALAASASGLHLTKRKKKHDVEHTNVVQAQSTRVEVPKVGDIPAASELRVMPEQLWEAGHEHRSRIRMGRSARGYDRLDEPRRIGDEEEGGAGEEMPLV